MHHTVGRDTVREAHAPASGRRRWHPSVRARTTGAGVAVFAVAMFAAAFVVVLVLGRGLSSQVETAASARAQDIVVALENSIAPSSLTRVGEGELIQIQDASGQVAAQSYALSGASPITSQTWPVEVTLAPGASETYLMVSKDVTSGPWSGYHVLVGRSLSSVDRYLRQLVTMFAIGVPLLLVVMGALTWLVVGTALRPVDAMRRRVDQITTTNLSARVPDPGGKDELAHLATTMNRMLARLEAGQRAGRRFVSDASHELRSPIASIRQNAEVAASYPGAISSVELAQTTLAETLRLQHLVDELLLLARADEQRLALHPVDVEVSATLAGHVAQLAGTGVQVDTTGLREAHALVDPVALDHMVRNLMDNAGRHARSAVALSTHLSGARVVIDIDDNGPGIPLADRERVFDRFVRLDAARSQADGGGGLGLSIVAELAAAHAATVAVLDSPLGGARLELTLPAAGS